MESQRPFVGIAVSSQRLDVAVLPDGNHFTVPYTDDGIALLVHPLRDLAPQMVLLEATGGYEIRVAYAVSEASLPVVIMNPKTLRHFAKSTAGRPRPINWTPRCWPTMPGPSSPRCAP